MAAPSLVWTAAAEPKLLADYEPFEFGWLRRGVAERARRTSGRRRSLANPAQDWLDRVRALDALAVLGVRLETVEDLQLLHGYVLEPAWRAGTALLVECDRRLSQLDPAAFADPGFGHAYTLGRALHAAHRIWKPEPRPSGAPEPLVALDAEQRRAVAARDGTIQVIAPAGSGKTTVLVERARELLRRGVPPDRILATTFNRDAANELEQRLKASGAGAVQTRTFHSLGLALLRAEGRVRPGGVRQPSSNEFKRWCALAARDTGTWVEVADARAAISQIKLGLLASPREYADKHAGDHADGAALARIYAAYEHAQAERRVNDFDDLVMHAVRALRSDDGLRERWQARFSHVLVDEYQDIEPAQELLVRILAAPEDALFCVGDDDQTLYGFRRASVRRMIELDRSYPGLERVALAHNYRCPPAVVAASKRLIDHNDLRFPKRIEPGAPDRERAIRLVEPGSTPEAAARIARTLAARARGEIVVLARTTNLLRTVALACADAHVRISAPPRVFEAQGARLAIEAHLRLCSEPTEATAEDVLTAFRMPNRGLPYEAEDRVAALLNDGFTFTEALAGLPADERRRSRLDQAGRVLDALAGMRDAGRFVRYLRSAGGLDEYFGEHDDGETEQIELEVLEQSEAEAMGKRVDEYAALLSARTDSLATIRDDAHGVELTTIHRAKGRQWPWVELFACDETQLPHRKALDVTPAQRAAGEGEEAERRLAYVAFTRAQERLVITTAGKTASRFLTEAGLQPARPYEPPRTSTSSPAPTRTADPALANALHVSERTGLSYALRTAPDRATALATAAYALEQRLVGERTTSERMTVATLLEAIETLDSDERAATIEAARTRPTALVARLTSPAQRRLAQALRQLPGDGSG